MSETIVIPCRSCSKKNRLAPDQALADLSKPVCGACRATLFLPLEEPLDAVETAHFQHPQDRRALVALRQIPGVETLTRMLIKESYERSEILRHYASYVRVGPEQLPELFGLFVGEPAAFQFFGSSTRRSDEVGTVVDPRELEELSPIETTLAGEDTGVVPVRLHARVTEVGTLDLSAVAEADARRWRLSFNVRVE